VFRAILAATFVWAGCGASPTIAGTAPAPVDLSPASLADSTRKQLDVARAVAARYASPAAARRDRYHRIAPPELTDLNPVAGEHWIKERLLRTRTLTIDQPQYLMYYPGLGADSLTLVGLAYAVGIPAGSPQPDGFAGDDDHWHVHLPCTRVPGLGGILADSREQCLMLNGQPGTMQISMLHVWTVASPDGPFAHYNPALPYLVSGLAVPPDDEFQLPERGRLLRELALALGETYGAVPRMGARIAQQPDSLFADLVRPQRERLRALVPALRDAQQQGDTAQFTNIALAAVRAWQTIRTAYLDAAVSPEHRSILGRWFEDASSPPTLRHHAHR